MPLGGSRSLPLLTATVIALHDVGRRYADGIEVKTLHTGQQTGFNRLDSRSFSCTRCASHDEHTRYGHDCVLIEQVGRSPAHWFQLRGNLLREWIGAKIAQLSSDVFAIDGDGIFTEGALKIYVRRFPLAQRSCMASRAVARKVTGGFPLTSSRP